MTRQAVQVHGQSKIVCSGSASMLRVLFSTTAGQYGGCCSRNPKAGQCHQL